MVDTEELARCFDADQLRGYSPIRNFTREERRVIAAALREMRADGHRRSHLSQNRQPGEAS